MRKKFIFRFCQRDIFRFFFKWCKTYFINTSWKRTLFKISRRRREGTERRCTEKEDVCVHGTSDVVTFAVAGNATRKCKYTISTHLRRRKRRTTVALSFSLSLSLSLYSSSSLVEEENEDGDDFFSSKLRWYQQLVFNLVQRVF